MEQIDYQKHIRHAHILRAEMVRNFFKDRRDKKMAYKQLKFLSNQQLFDIGIDPHLLNKGPKYFPWKAK